MKQYLCHKRVKAAQIVDVRLVHQAAHDEYRLTLDDGEIITEKFGEGLVSRYTPKTGDYLVEYEPDGYRSISPQKAFEDGYHEFTPEASS